MTDKLEMPGVIWAYKCKHMGMDTYTKHKDAVIHDTSKTTQYHHTAALIEKIEGMKRKDVFYNTAIQDVIDILKGERE